MAKYASYKTLYLDDGNPIIYADIPTVTGTYYAANDSITVLFTSNSLSSALVNDGDYVQYTFINGAVLRATKHGSVAHVEFSDREAETWETLTTIPLSSGSNSCLMLLANENKLGTYSLAANTDLFTLLYSPLYSSGIPGQGYFNKRGTFNAQYSGWNENAYSVIVLGNAAPDPYEDGGTSGTGGGTGTFSGMGDSISIPSLPTLSATDAGFITLFNPTAGQMAQLANYMWTNPLFDLENWRKIFADPMDAILGLSIVPVDVPSGGAREVKVGNISTGISMTVASSQYVEVDCGTLNVEEFWGAYLDYEPYTTAEIYLPYCGTHAIKVDDIMGKSVRVVYHVDVLSGGCCCYVQCGGSVLYTFLGQCATSIPITGDNWTRLLNGAIQIASSVGSMVASGGANISGMTGIASAAANIAKPSIEKSGAMGGPGGLLAVQTPYLILTRPRQALPAKQNSFTGYPSFITEKLGTLTGYTEVYAVHLEGIPATESEITEIENLLKGGVIF